MGYKILISPRALIEIDEAIEYYLQNSANAPFNFIKSLTETYLFLQENPNQRIRYKNIRSIKLKVFPHSLFFIADDYKSIIKILSCFHNKRNPTKHP